MSDGTRPARRFGPTLACLIVGAVIGNADQSLCQPDLDGPLSVDDCVRIALGLNDDLIIARDQREQALGRSRQSLSGVLPSVVGSAAYAYDRSRSPQVVPGQDLPDYEGKSEGRSVNLTVTQPVFDWSSWQQLRGSRTTADASLEDVESTAQEVALQVKIRYYELLKAKRLHEVRIESVELREQQRDRAQTLFDVGSVAKNDVLQARVNLQQARLEEIQARNLVELERAQLAQLMGVSIIAEFVIVDDLDPAPAAPVDSLMIWREALAQRPDLKSAELRARAGALNLSAARGGRYPSLFARYQQYWGNRASTQIEPPPSDPGQGTAETEPRNWSFVAGVSWDLFDGMLTEGRIKEAKAQKISTENELRKAQRVAALEIKEAILGIRYAQQSITAAEVAVALAAENLKLATERYQLGSGTLLELEEAQVGLVDARRSQVEAQALLKVAEATLDKARGRGLPEE